MTRLVTMAAFLVFLSLAIGGCTEKSGKAEVSRPEVAALFSYVREPNFSNQEEYRQGDPTTNPRPDGGDYIVVHGEKPFAPSDMIYVNGKPCSDVVAFKYESNYTIKGRLPANAPGDASVIVKNPAGNVVAECRKIRYSEFTDKIRQEMRDRENAKEGRKVIDTVVKRHHLRTLYKEPSGFGGKSVIWLPEAAWRNLTSQQKKYVESYMRHTYIKDWGVGVGRVHGVDVLCDRLVAISDPKR
jgi:hypothetical protein